MRCILSLAVVVVLLPGLAFAAGPIGLNFSSDRELAEIAPDESAGVVPQIRWNNWIDIPSDVPTPPTVGDQTGIVSPNAGVVTDDAGVQHPGVTVSWSSVNAWNTNNGVANGDNKLMNGYIDNNADFPQVSIEVGGLPASITDPGYDVIVYFGSDANGRTGSITDGTTTYSYTTFSAQAENFPASYTLTTDTGGGNPDSNYAIFSGHSGSSFNITLDRGSNNSGIHGLQIVPIPEPSSIALVLLGVIGFAMRYRRRN